jgi:dipeptidyl aminopeptidase/acylaminoacyl peptidase
MARVGQPEPIPGTGAAVVPVTTYDIDENRGSGRLWQIGIDGTTKPLTRAGIDASAPAPSPDGALLAFLRRDDDDKPQLHVMPLGGGEPEAVTDLPLGAGAAVWTPDGSKLVFAAPLYRDHPSLDATAAAHPERVERKMKAVVTEHRVYRHWDKWLAGALFHHLLVYDLATASLRDLTPSLDAWLALEDPAGTFDVSPDGTEVAFVADISPPPHGVLQFAVHTVPLLGGSIHRMTADPPADQRRPRYSPDGRFLLFGFQREPDFYADRVRLASYDRDAGTETVLTENWDRSAAGWEWIDDDTIVLSAEDEARVRLFTMGITGTHPAPLTEGGATHGPRPAGDRIWCRYEDNAHPPEVAVVAGGERRIVGRFNDALLAELDLKPAEWFTFAGAEGNEVQGWLVYPPGFDPDRQWPLLHNIHGGPHGVSGDGWHWRWNTQVFAAAGYVVASVNFHGSSGWGQDFAASILGTWGAQPAADVLASSDHLVDRGIIDPDRMAVAGGSYGGYLAAWLTTMTDRFAAAICHAGVTDVLGQWASDVTAGRERSIGGLPWEDLDAVQRWSPATHTANVVTPTLVIHGELDYRVVVTQGLLWYGLLMAKGVPSRLVYYPDEGHWIQKPQNSLHWYDEFLSWLDRWIGPES